MNILVTGGCGYVGSILIPKLISDGHKIINIDTQWFGNYLKKSKNLRNLKLNLSEINKINLKKINCCIHLASIANDPMAELDKNLSWETSALNTHILIEKLIQSKVKRIIYASSGSVYGISKKNRVTEETELKPISLYNKVKMVTERIILSYSHKIESFIIRPATVCGYSPRMRLDVAVNALTFSALNDGLIRIFGGSQIRPNIHIDDMCDLYRFFIKTNKKNVGIYNAGFENKSISEIAGNITKVIPSKSIVIKNLSDPRSYKLDSSKLLKIGFKPKKKIKDAIIELRNNFNQNILKQKPNFHSLNWLKKILKNS
jgi:nucleoside-diphosphate-sugar epimerase